MTLARKAFAVVALALSLAPLGAGSQTLPLPSEQIVWHWFGECSEANLITAEVLLNGKSIYKSSFPICRMRRGDIQPKPQQRILYFFFQEETKSLFGEPQAQQIEGNIWEAGGEHNSIILGVSFSTKDRIWLNTLHNADPEKASESALTTGLTMKTYPAKGRAKKS